MTTPISQAIEALESCWHEGLTDNNWKQVETALASLRALQEGEWPPWPKAYDLQHDDSGRPQILYTADQMREYARLALAAAGGGVPQGEIVAWLMRDGKARWVEFENPTAASALPVGWTACPLYASPQPEAAQLIEWTDKDGVKHRISINGARELLHKFYDEWPGGWSEVKAEQRARAEAAPAVAQVPQGADFLQFLSDVTTAAGLLEHGRRDKGLAARIGDEAFRLRRATRAAVMQVPQDQVQTAAWNLLHAIEVVRDARAGEENWNDLNEKDDALRAALDAAPEAPAQAAPPTQPEAAPAVAQCKAATPKDRKVYKDIADLYFHDTQGEPSAGEVERMPLTVEQAEIILGHGLDNLSDFDLKRLMTKAQDRLDRVLELRAALSHKEPQR